jgi:hypothetical protein
MKRICFLSLLIIALAVSTGYQRLSALSGQTINRGGLKVGSSGYQTLPAAITAIGRNRRVTLSVPAGVYTILSNLTIPSNVALEVLSGANIVISPGVTLNIRGPFTGGSYQVFTDNSGNSAQKGVKFAKSCALLSVSPEWWGAVADGSTDCAPAINLALNAGAGCAIPVQFGAGTYKCNSSINLNASVGLLGVAGGRSILTTPSNISWSLINSDNSVQYASMQNLTFTAGSGCRGKLVNISGGHYIVIRNCTFNTLGYPTDGSSWGLYIASTKSKVHDNTFTGNAGAWFGGSDGWFYSNQIIGPGHGVGNSVGLMNGEELVDSNTVSGWNIGVFMGYTSFIAAMFDSNSVSQCLYGLKGSYFLLGFNYEAGPSGFITNNTIFSNTYGYTCANHAAPTPEFGVVIQGNKLYNNNVGTGPEAVANAAIFENNGHHIITQNTFTGNNKNISGNGKDTIYSNTFN